MDKQTLSNYGLLTVVTLILAVMLAFATPFGTYVGDGVVSIANGFVGASDKGLDEDNIDKISNRFENKLNDTLREGIIPTGATYTPNSGTTLVGNGTNKFPDTPQTGDTYEEGDYIYKYNQYFSYDGNSWSENTSQNGWSVRVKENTKTTYGKILVEIAGQPVNTMFSTFSDCASLTTSPTIPNSVTSMHGTFLYCTSLTTAPTIPSSVNNVNYTFDGCASLKTYAGSTDVNGDFSNYTIPSNVTDMRGTFWGCKSLTTAPVIPNKVIDMGHTFMSCTSLTGTITINANINISSSDYYDSCFHSTFKPIVLAGSSPNLELLAGTANNNNVTVLS